MPRNFTFVLGQNTFSVTAISLADAMGLANAHFRAHLDQGAWMDTSTPDSYRWTCGNFFD